MTKPEGDTKKGAPRLSTKKRVFFLVVVIVLLAFLAEGAVRVRQRVMHGYWSENAPSNAGKLYEYHPFLVTAPIPGAHYVNTARKTDIRINSLGFRGPEIEREKKPGTFRVVCLGGSTTFGHGLPADGDEWPRKLEEMLAADAKAGGRYSAVEVVNAGVPGYTTAQALINLAMRCVDLGPDLVIVYHAHNDISLDRAEGVFSSDYSHRYAEKKADTLGDRLCRVSLLAYKIRKVRRRNAYNSSVERRRESDLPDDVSDAALDTFARNLGSIVAVARAHGAAVLLSTMAYRFDEETPVEELEKGNWIYFPNISPRGYYAAHVRYNDRIRETAAGRSTYFCDSEKALGKNPGNFADDVHLTREGAVRLAEGFRSVIVESGLLAGEAPK